MYVVNNSNLRNMIKVWEQIYADTVRGRLVNEADAFMTVNLLKKLNIANNDLFAAYEWQIVAGVWLCKN